MALHRLALSFSTAVPIEPVWGDSAPADSGAEQLVARANEALYEAKKFGRDRVVVNRPITLLAA